MRRQLGVILRSSITVSPKLQPNSEDTHQKKFISQDIVMQVSIPKTWRLETRELGIQGQPELRQSLSQQSKARQGGAYL